MSFHEWVVLCHPAIRYLHRLLAGTVLGWFEAGKVRKVDIYFLYHIIHAKPIDTGAFLINQMEHTAKRKNGGSAIVQGAFVTHIVLHIGYKDCLFQEEFFQGTDSLDYTTCTSMCWCSKIDGTLFWWIGDDEDELPPLKKMDLRNQVNWLLQNNEAPVRAPLLLESAPALNSSHSCSTTNDIVA